jgi:hypothetical protein
MQASYRILQEEVNFGAGVFHVKETRFRPVITITKERYFQGETCALESIGWYYSKEEAIDISLDICNAINREHDRKEKGETP